MHAHVHTRSARLVLPGPILPPPPQAYDYACYFYDELPHIPLTPRLSPDGKDESSIDINTLRVTGGWAPAAASPCVCAAAGGHS